MPRRSPVRTLQLPGLAKGLNRESDPFQLEMDESPDALNVDFGQRGSVAKRSGYTVWSAAEPSNPITRFVIWTVQGGSTHYIAVDETDGSVWAATGSTLVDTTKGVGAATNAENWPIAIASLENLLYVTSLRTGGGPLSFDGTTWTSETGSDLDGTGNVFPNARHLIVAHERMFAANLTEETAGTRHRSRVAWSNSLDAETWDANDWIDFDPDDGDQITAMVKFGEAIVIFKENSVQLLAGKTPDSFTRFSIDNRLGTESPGTVQSVGNELLFFDVNSGVWGFDGAGFEQKDENINSYLLDGLNRSMAYKATAFVFRNKYYLSLPWATDTNPSRTFVLDLRTRAWTEWDFGVFDAAEFQTDLYGASPRDANGVFKLEDGSASDNGASISAYAFTSWMMPEGISLKHRIRRIDTVWTALGNHNVTMTMYRNFNNNSPYVEQTINTNVDAMTWGTDNWGDTWGAAADEILVRGTGWGQRWRAIQFKFSTASSTEKWQLNRMNLAVSTVGSPRDE